MLANAQSFEYYARKVLSGSSGILTRMAKFDLNQLVAKNLNYFMQRPKSLYKNANALGKVAKIAPNTIRNLLDPTKRTVTAEKPDGFPLLDTLAKIAPHLGCDVWELLHPDIEKAVRQREVYELAESGAMDRMKRDETRREADKMNR